MTGVTSGRREGKGLCATGPKELLVFFYNDHIRAYLCDYNDQNGTQIGVSRTM